MSTKKISERANLKIFSICVIWCCQIKQDGRYFSQLNATRIKRKGKNDD